MKRLKYIIITLLMLSPVFIPQAQAQSSDAVFGAIAQSIQAGNAQQLSGYFNSTLEVTVKDKEANYSSQQAQFVVRDFFAGHPVKSFQIIHKGNSGGTHYATGSYVSTKGTFETTIYIKQYGDKYLIDVLRFESE